jgi:hypothetical protein
MKFIAILIVLCGCAACSASVKPNPAKTCEVRQSSFEDEQPTRSTEIDFQYEEKKPPVYNIPPNSFPNELPKPETLK